jgi:hypothetical protein
MGPKIKNERKKPLKLGHTFNFQDGGNLYKKADHITREPVLNKMYSCATNLIQNPNTAKCIILGY